MKKLPIGIQTFSKIREEGYLYVDKTPQIHRLLTTGNYFFISRPRRFGKSLTLSTIKEIYSGNRALFEGLWIENQWNWEKIHPVVHIQFNEIGYNTNGLETALHQTLDREAERFEVTLPDTSYDQKFRFLLEKVAQKRGKVVLLVDEYDKPLIDYLEKEDIHLAFEHQKILKYFYSIIKSADPYIEFLLITGVSKFSKVSIFSDLNNLRDITLSPTFGTLTGYTQTELEYFFEEWINYTITNQPQYTRETLLNDVKSWYNGYTWNGTEHVYNPFSILNFFADGRFQDYWFHTGTPTFLVKKLKEARLFELNNLHTNDLVLESYALDNLELRSLLFQTGYLTIKKMDPSRGTYILGYPNREVEQALSRHLIGALLQRSPVDATRPIIQLEEAFLHCQPEGVVTVIQAMLKDVPSHLLQDGKEYFYHALVHLHFRYLGFFIQSEVHTSDGRMDAVVHTDSHVYLLEFKIDQSAAVAIEQIKNKKYADKFRTEGKTIVAIGINFDTTQRGVGDWAAETL